MSSALALGGDHRGLWARDRPLARLPCGCAQREPLSPPRGPPPVACLVRDDPQQPRAERCPIAKAGQRVVGLEKGVLDGIVGIGLRAHEVRGPDGDVLVAAHDLFVRRDVTGPGALDQVGVFDVDGPPRIGSH